jgi:AraC-like DNA-binding protein
MQAHLLSMPYNQYGRRLPSDIASVARIIKPADLVAIDIDASIDSDGLIRQVETLRKTVPWAVLTGRLRGRMTSQAVHILGSAAVRGLRAVLHEAEPLEPTLRPMLTRLPDSLLGVPDWIMDVAGAPGCGVASRLTESPELFHLVRTLFLRPATVPDVEAAAKLIGRSEDSLRRLLKRCHLPTAAAWIRLATRLLPDALALQEDATSLARTAILRGWSDQSALTRAFTLSFGWTPGQVSRRLGWEWLLHAWLMAQDQRGTHY